MKKLIITAIAILASCATLTLSAQEQEKEKEMKTGWSFGILPTATFSADNGFQAGAFGDVYYYGDGSTYPDPLHKISWEASYFTKSHRMRLYLAYDSKYLIPGMRINASITYMNDPLYSFWGFNGPAAFDSGTPQSFTSVNYALWGNRALTPNINYFGDPIYMYSLKEGIEDGFLAPFKVINIKTDIGEGWRPLKGQLDKYGNPIEDRIYTNSDYDYTIVIEDRIEQVASEITKYLKTVNRMAKTIVFCATEDAAERMRVALVNHNADMVQKNPDYVVRITGSDDYGKKKLDYFISVAEPYPVIATTSKLLSTGVDC